MSVHISYIFKRTARKKDLLFFLSVMLKATCFNFPSKMQPNSTRKKVTGTYQDWCCNEFENEMKRAGDGKKVRNSSKRTGINEMLSRSKSVRIEKYDIFFQKRIYSFIPGLSIMFEQ